MCICLFLTINSLQSGFKTLCGTHLFKIYGNPPTQHTHRHTVAINITSKEQLTIKVFFSLLSCHQLELCWHCFCSNLTVGKFVPTGILWHGKSSINNHTLIQRRDLVTINFKLNYITDLSQIKDIGKWPQLSEGNQLKQ